MKEIEKEEKQKESAREMYEIVEEVAGSRNSVNFSLQPDTFLQGGK